MASEAKCQRCGTDDVRPYGHRWYCLRCGWTWHQLSQSLEEEVATRIETTKAQPHQPRRIR
jgi:ribosomal protein L37AE/L43A